VRHFFLINFYVAGYSHWFKLTCDSTYKGHWREVHVLLIGRKKRLLSPPSDEYYYFLSFLLFFIMRHVIAITTIFSWSISTYHIHIVYLEDEMRYN
jgi:hypothetical protein